MENPNLLPLMTINTADASLKRTRYLDEASKLLLIASPSTSSYLQSLHQEQRPKSSGGSEHKNTTVCSACGTFQIPGWSCRKLSQDHIAKRPRTRKERIASNGKAKVVSLQCLRCESIHQIVSERTKTNMKRAQDEVKPEPVREIQTIEAMHPSRAQILSQTPLTQSTSLDKNEPSSRKRVRSKKSSLQALLAERKPAGISTGYGLGLGDFMK